MDSTLAPPGLATPQVSPSPPSSDEYYSSPPSSPPSSLFDGDDSDSESASGRSEGGEQEEGEIVDKSSKGKEKAEDTIERSPEPESDVPSLWPTMPGNIVQMIMAHNSRNHNSMALNARICKPWYFAAIENLYRYLVITNYATLEMVVENRYFKMSNRLPTFSIDISGVTWCDKVEKLLALSAHVVELRLNIDIIPPILFAKFAFRALEELVLDGSFAKVHKSYVQRPDQAFRPLNLRKLFVRVFEAGSEQIAYQMLQKRLQHLAPNSLDFTLSVGAFRPDLITVFDPLATAVDTLTLRTEKSLFLPQVLGSALPQFAPEVHVHIVDSDPTAFQRALPSVWKNLVSLKIEWTKHDRKVWRAAVDDLTLWYQGGRPLNLESVNLVGCGLEWAASREASRFLRLLDRSERDYGRKIDVTTSEFEAIPEVLVKKEEMRRVGRLCGI